MDNVIELDRYRARAPRRWSPAELAADSYEIGELVTAPHGGQRVRGAVVAVTRADGQGRLTLCLTQGARRGALITVDVLEADRVEPGA